MQTKVAKIEPKTYLGKVTGHSIVLENGTSGYLDDKGSDKDIREGEFVEFSLQVKQNKRGENYNLLTLKRAGSSTITAPPNTSGSVYKPQSAFVPSGKVSDVDIFDKRCEGVFNSMELVMKAVYEDKLGFDQVKETFANINGDIQSAIDEMLGK